MAWEFFDLYCKELINLVETDSPNEAYNRLEQLRKMYESRLPEGDIFLNRIVEEIEYNQLLLLKVYSSHIEHSTQLLKKHLLAVNPSIKEDCKKRAFDLQDYNTFIEYIYEHCSKKIQRDKYIINDVNVYDECFKASISAVNEYCMENNFDLMHLWMGYWQVERNNIKNNFFNISMGLVKNRRIVINNTTVYKLVGLEEQLSTYVLPPTSFSRKHIIFEYWLWLLEEIVRKRFGISGKLSPNMRHLENEAKKYRFNSEGDLYDKLISIYKSMEFKTILTDAVEKIANTL